MAVDKSFRVGVCIYCLLLTYFASLFTPTITVLENPIAVGYTALKTGRKFSVLYEAFHALECHRPLPIPQSLLTTALPSVT